MHEKKCYNNHQNFQLSWKGCARATSKSFSKRNSSGEHKKKKKLADSRKILRLFFLELAIGFNYQMNNDFLK